MINIGDKLYLNDKNSYLVVNKTYYQDKMYLLLVDDINNQNIKICYEKEENNSVVEVLDEELIKNLGPCFAKTAEVILEKNPEYLEMLKNAQN